MCGFLLVRVDSDHSFPATWSLRWSVFCSAVCLWSFLMERQLARAAHLPCKTQNENIASDAALAARSNVAASASGRISQRMTTSPSRKCTASRPVANRCARRCAECCLYQWWTLFGSAYSFVFSRNRPTRRHTTTIECVCGRRRGFASV